VLLPGSWKRLTLYRLGDIDLFLSKLVRDDALDLQMPDLLLSKQVSTDT
jgi:hypothetical protein